MRTPVKILTIILLIALSGPFLSSVNYANSSSAVKRLAAPTVVVGPKILLDANSTSQTDVLVQNTVSAIRTFRVGAILNASTTLPLNGVFGWQFAINYDPNVLVPQADPAVTTSYPDGAGSTVLFGSQVPANWAAKIAAGQAFGSFNVPNRGKVLVFFTLLAPAAPVNVASRTLLANLAFELTNKTSTPITLSLSDIVILDSTASSICTCPAGPGISASVLNDPPRAGLIVFKAGDFSYTFNATSSRDTDGSIPSPSGYYWDFGDGTQDLGVTGPVVNHDYGPSGTNLAPGIFDVSLRVVDDKGATGSARSQAGNLIINTQLSHTSYKANAVVPDFDLKVTPQTTNLTAGHTTYLTLNLTSVNGFSGNVTLSTSSPSYIILSINATSLSLVPGGVASTFVRLTALASAPIGSVLCCNITGTSGSITHTISITVIITQPPPPPDQPPLAAFSYTPLNAVAGGTITFDGLGSFDPDGHIIQWYWSFGDGFYTSNATVVYHSFSYVGSYTVTLTVTDNAGLSSSTSRSIQIGSSDIPPVAGFSYSPQIISPGDFVSFDGGQSYDPDGQILSYDWSFGDGYYYNYGPRTVQHTYNNAGNYTVTLTVRDNAGLTGSTSQTVRVRTPFVHDVAVQYVSVSNNPIVQTQVVNVQVALRNLGSQTETVNVTVYYDHHVIGTQFGMTVYPGPYNYNYAYFTWDTTNVQPGNYTVSAAVFLPTDQNLANNNYTVPYPILILPPPVLSISPAGGAVGTTVMVFGSGFPRTYYPGEVFVTFDDMLMGFGFTTFNSYNFSSYNTGRLNFTFSIPHAQPGIHRITFLDLYTLVKASATFTVLPEPQPASTLEIVVDTGPIYFPGEAQVAYVKITGNNGTAPDNPSILVSMFTPDGKTLTLSPTRVSPGFYRITYNVPAKGPLGTYGLLVKVFASNGQTGSGLVSFEVKPTWVQAHGQTILSLTTVAGALGVLGMAWQKGCLRRKEEE